MRYLNGGQPTPDDDIDEGGDFLMPSLSAAFFCGGTPRPHTATLSPCRHAIEFAGCADRDAYIALRDQIDAQNDSSTRIGR